MSIDAKSVNVWQVDVRPFADGQDPVKLCLEEGVVGIGWRISGRPSSKEDYWEKAKAIYSKNAQWARAATPFLFQMKENDLVWMKDFAGIYYLGRIESDWEYRDEPAYLQAEMVNVRKCSFYKVGLDAPGGVMQGFRTGNIVQKINDYPIHLFSRIAYNRLSGEEFYDAKGEIGESADLFRLLTDEELEDLVALYLQKKGYCIIPSSLAGDIPLFKFQIVQSSTGERAFVQVSGNAVLNPGIYTHFPYKVFLFSPAGYSGSFGTFKNVVALKRDEIEDFIKSYQSLMSFSVRLFLDCTKESAAAKKSI